MRKIKKKKIEPIEKLKNDFLLKKISNSFLRIIF